MDITAGLAKLKTQINKLERRIHSLDMEKVSPKELHPLIESLNALKERYKEMQEEHAKKKQEKESKSIKVDTDDLVKEHEQLVDVLKSPSHADDAQEAKKQEKELNEYKEAKLSCPKCGSDHIQPAEGYKLNKCLSCHLAFDNESAPDYEEPEHKEAAPENEFGFDPKDENVPCTTCSRTDLPLHTDMKCPNCSTVPDREKQSAAPKEEEPAREEKWPEPSATVMRFPHRSPRKMPKHRIVDVPAPTTAPQEKKSDVEKYAIHDVVEPARGTPGSKGRVMGHDEANDMVYVAWQEGKLKDSHGYGAYSAKDLKKHAAKEENNWPLCSVPGCKQKEDTTIDGKRYCYTHSWGKKKKAASQKIATWQDKLQNVYSSFEEFQAFDETYGLSQRLGFPGSQEAWDANPTVQGSTNPADYKVVGSLEKKAGPGAGREFEVKKNEITSGTCIYNMETGKVTWKQLPEIIAFDLHGYYDGMSDINGNLVKITDVAAGWWEGGQANIKMDIAGIVKQWVAEYPDVLRDHTGDVEIGVDINGLTAMLGGGYMRTTYKPGDTFQACGDGAITANYEMYDISLCATIQWQEGTTEFEQDVFENTSPGEREDGQPLEDYDYQDHYEMQTEPYHAPRKQKSSKEDEVVKEADDEINDHDMDDSGESADEPTEEDIFIQSIGHLGSGTAAFQNHKQIATLDNSLDDPWQDFYTQIMDSMEGNNYFPTVWDVSDHGNVRLSESFYEFTKERQMEQEQPALETVSAVHEGFDVFLNGKWIDKVFATGYDEEEMRNSLINHDGYDPNITVRKERKKQTPMRMASLDKRAKVVKHKDGWHVMSEEGKNLGGPYDSKPEAVKRLRQVEYFKHHKGSLNKSATSWNVLENGDLEISTDPKTLDMNPEELDSDNAMYELLEPVTANGLAFVAPESIGALTDAPILTDGDPEALTDESNIWWFPDYMVKSPARELAETGKVIFKKASKKKADGGTIPLSVFDGGYYAIETSGKPDVPHAYAIFNGQKQQVMVITTKEPISTERIESIVHDEYGKKQLVRATLKEDHETLKSGSKFVVSGINHAKKEIRVKADKAQVWIPLSKVAVSAENLEQQINDMKTKMTNTQERLQQVVTTNATVDATAGVFQVGDRVTDPRKGDGTVTYVSHDQITVDWDWIGQSILGPEPIPMAKTKSLKKLPPQPEVQASVEKSATDPRPNTIPPPGMRWVLDEDTQPAMWVLVKKEGL